MHMVSTGYWTLKYRYVLTLGQYELFQRNFHEGFRLSFPLYRGVEGS